MIAGNSLPSRVQALVSGTLLLLFGTMAFSKPMLDNGKPVSGAQALAAAPAIAVRVAELPTVAVITPVANSPEVPVVAAVVPVPAVATGKRTVAAKKTASAITVVAKATAASDRNEFVAPAAEPVITLALAQTAAPPVADSGIDTVEAKPETYADWSDILTLANAATSARDAGVESITEWNRRAELCGVPVKGSARFELNLHKAECRSIRDAMIDVDQISSFWGRCVNFIRTYNGLFRRFARAEKSQFVDQGLVGNELNKSYRTLSEFCNTDIYRQKYPRMIILIGQSQFSLLSGVGYSSLETVDYRSAYTGGIPPNN